MTAKWLLVGVVLLLSHVIVFTRAFTVRVSRLVDFECLLGWQRERRAAKKRKKRL